MPGIADPGRALVRAALAAGAEVTVLPGPGAVETALVASGLAADRYAFRGWVPRAAAARRAFLAAAATAGHPVVVFESPRRAAPTLAALAEVAPDARCALCRELTKLYEEVLRGTASELSAALEGRELRGEVAIVIAGARARTRPRTPRTALVCGRRAGCGRGRRAAGVVARGAPHGPAAAGAVRRGGRRTAAPMMLP